MISSKSICLILLLSCGALKLNAQERYSSSEYPIIKKAYTKLEKKYDTILVYERTCGGCSEGVIATVYFFYRDARNSYLKVYTKDLSTRKVTRIGMVKNANVKKVLDYAINNYDSLSMISGTQDIYTEYEVTRINDSMHKKTLIRGGGDDGPVTNCYIKLGNKSMSNSLYGVSRVKDYFIVSPLIGNFFTLMHEAYSKYTKTQIVDMD